MKKVSSINLTEESYKVFYKLYTKLVLDTEEDVAIRWALERLPATKSFELLILKLLELKIVEKD